MENPNKIESSVRIQKIKSALEAGSLAGACEIGEAILSYRKEKTDLPELLMKGLKPAYHSKYVNLARNLTPSDRVLAERTHVSLRAALKLLPLFGFADAEGISASRAEEIRNTAKSLLASFSNKRGETKEWEEKVESAIKLYSKSIEYGPLGQFLFQRHRAIERALGDANQEVAKLKGLAPDAESKTQIAQLLESIKNAQTQHEQIQALLNRVLDALKKK